MGNDTLGSLLSWYRKRAREQGNSLKDGTLFGVTVMRETAMIRSLDVFFAELKCLVKRKKKKKDFAG